VDGTGERVFDPESTVPSPAGSYVVHYPNMGTHDCAKNE